MFRKTLKKLWVLKDPKATSHIFNTLKSQKYVGTIPEVELDIVNCMMHGEKAGFLGRC